GIVGVLLMLILGPLAAAVIQMAISRSREFQADASGASLSDDPPALADALRLVCGAAGAGRRAPQDPLWYPAAAVAGGGAAHHERAPDDRQPVPGAGPGQPVLHASPDAGAGAPARGDGANP